MFPLRDRTRRLFLVALFLILGPLATAVLIGRIISRMERYAVPGEEEKLSKLLNQPVQIRGIKYQSPYRRLYRHISLSDRDSGQVALFCPQLEVQWLSYKKFRDEWAQRFPNEKSVLHFTNNPRQQELPRFSRILYLKIPQLHLRIEEAAFVQELLKKFPGLDSSTMILFDIGQLKLCQETELTQIIQETAQASPPLDVPGDFETFTEPSGITNQDEKFLVTDLAPVNVQNWIVNYDIDRPSFLRRITGFLTRFENTGVLNSSFYFNRIETTEPVHFIWEKQENHPAQFYLDAKYSPFPCSFATLFNPIFQLTNRESWFTGVLTTESTGQNSIRYNINEFHLYRCDLTPLVRQVTTSKITGTVIDLFFENATIENGVFCGNGSVRLVKGSIARNLLLRFQEEFQLEITPSTTLFQQFDNNNVPFDDLEVRFVMSDEGIQFYSKYPSRIIAVYQQSNFAYRFFLPESQIGKTIPYPRLITALGNPASAAPFWTPLYRNAINHLPVKNVPADPETTAPLPNPQ